MASANYRLAKKEDINSLAALRYEFTTEVGDSDGSVSEKKFLSSCIKFLAYGLKNKTWNHFIAEIDGKIIGHASLMKIEMIPRPHRKFKHFGYLTNFYVKAEYRNKKIGKKLLENLIKFTKTNDYESVIVWPSDESKSLYSRANFANKNGICELVL